MKTIEQKYFPTLGAALSYSRKRIKELKKLYTCYIAANVWDAWKDHHFENGVYMRYVFIADIWPDRYET